MLEESLQSLRPYRKLRLRMLFASGSLEDALLFCVGIILRRGEVLCRILRYKCHTQRRIKMHNIALRDWKMAPKRVRGSLKISKSYRKIRYRIHFPWRLLEDVLYDMLKLAWGYVGSVLGPLLGWHLYRKIQGKRPIASISLLGAIFGYLMTFVWRPLPISLSLGDEGRTGWYKHWFFDGFLMILKSKREFLEA